MKGLRKGNVILVDALGRTEGLRAGATGSLAQGGSTTEPADWGLIGFLGTSGHGDMRT